jgi:hypothetical protein
MNSPFTGADPVRGFRVFGLGRKVSEIYFDSSVSASSDPANNNLFTAGNRLKSATFSDFSIYSNNANQNAWYFWCSATNDGTEYPGWGSGAQNDICFQGIELRGAWNRGWGLDGDTGANLNSEMMWDRCAASNDATFGDAVVRSGVGTLTSQMDQFLNYIFVNCRFEYASGDCLAFDKGGFITIIGGSWIMGIGTSSGGSFFKMADTSHADDVKQLHVLGTRFEMRNTAVKLIDTYWRNINSYISMQGITTANTAIASGSRAEHEMMHFRSTDASIPFVDLVGCDLGGHIKVTTVGSGSGGSGRLSFRMGRSKQYGTPGVVSGHATSGFVRYLATGGVRTRWQDWSGISDSTVTV